ncbi:hypothetical protein GE061_017716 [Apolygus lucorum]|uniref:Uncharacterized protein n=1 Tax=Apolygus lucorum TaxID=248454 RepID=A0A8S9XBY2_APOLU|nr:hypothetical protein GE061_017716 [Apolygus lucorum]
MACEANFCFINCRGCDVLFLGGPKHDHLLQTGWEMEGAHGKLGGSRRRHVGLPPVNVSGCITILTAYVACASVCEHTMAVLYNRNPCHITWEQYYLESFRQLFCITNYSLWKGLTASFFNFLMASTWNLTDLFLMALSVALSARFKHLISNWSLLFTRKWTNLTGSK